MTGLRGKVIHCVLPNEGSDKRLLKALRSEFDLLSATSAQHLGIAVLADTRTEYGKLPVPQLVRLVTILCEESQADAVFDFVFNEAEIHKPGHGLLWQGSVPLFTPCCLPEDVPEEED